MESGNGPNQSNVKQIGVAIVRHGTKVLVGVRGEGVPLAGYAEFPGGKCEPGESPEACSIRECREESGLEVVPLRSLLTESHDYPHGTVELHFWLCEPLHPDQIQPRQQNFFWIEMSDLSRWRFPEGNLRVVEILTRLNGEDKTN